MSTTEQPVSAMPRRTRVQLAVAVAIFGVAGYVFWLNTRGQALAVNTEAKRPLLKVERKEFADDQAGIRFTPPPSWSVQAMSTEAPGTPVRQRLVVKYKQLLPGRPAAWLRVHVGDAVAGKSIVDIVRDRDPGPGWTLSAKVQSVAVAGLPGARITYQGRYNDAPSVREIIGVERNGKVFFFTSTCQVTDRAAVDQIARALESVVFLR